MTGWDESDRVPDAPRKGRGAVSNRTGRYEATERYRVDDGWDLPIEEDALPVQTTVSPDASRRVITTNNSPDVGFDQSVNPYRGCEHGCVYCFARPTHAWLGLSPGLDFETKLFAKHDAAALLERELQSPGYRCKVIALGVITDAYQPIERRLGITRSVLEVLSRFSHPVSLISKSALVARDVDILADMAARGLVHVTLSITSLDRELARRLEPRASTPARRLEAVRTLAAAGVPTSVNVAPVIPGLNDHELESILGAAADAGACKAGYILLRLPLEIKDLFREWLEANAPDRAARVLSLVRQTRGGALYKDKFGERMRGEGPIAELLERRFRVACTRLGLDKRDYVLDTSLFKRPPAKGDQFALPL